MRAAVCMIGVALLAALVPHQTLSQNREALSSADVFQSYSANDLYALSGGFKITVRSDSTSRWPNNAIRLVGSDNADSGPYWPSRFPTNRAACLAPHNAHDFSWSMVMRQPLTDQGESADRDRNRDKARGTQRDWDPSYYVRWREIDKDCR